MYAPHALLVMYDSWFANECILLTFTIRVNYTARLLFDKRKLNYEGILDFRLVSLLEWLITPSDLD